MVLAGLVRGKDVREGEEVKVKCKEEKNKGKVVERRGEKGGKKRAYLKYRHIGSATLRSNTPGGSTILKQVMVVTYWERMSFMSASGRRRHFRFLES